ncbi:MAG: GYD domain-containing protein, partial [Anaerolineae bacterium]|nr:GYD domain-containing protein [Anaerolineae bacterium]
MPGYIQLIKYTKEGLADIKNSPQRIKEARAAAEKLGIRVVGVWVTMGEYDLVSIGDAPNDEAVAVYTLALARLGNVTTQTMRAFSEDEFAQIVSKLP